MHHRPTVTAPADRRESGTRSVTGRRRGARGRPLALVLSLALAAATILGPLRWAPASVHACSYDTSDIPPGGVLGAPSNYASGGITLTVPRNAAFLWYRSWLDGSSTPPVIANDRATGAAVLGVEVPSSFVSDLQVLLRPTVPLDPTRNYRDPHTGVMLVPEAGDDTTPPEAPVILAASLEMFDLGGGGCGGSGSCGSGTTTSIQIQLAGATADQPFGSEHLTYAAYVGFSREEALTGPYALKLFIGAPTFRLDLSGHPSGHDVYVSLAAIDQAGNIGPRSEPFLVEQEGGNGCSVVGPGGRTDVSAVPGLLAALGLLIVASASRALRRPRVRGPRAGWLDLSGEPQKQVVHSGQRPEGAGDLLARDTGAQRDGPAGLHARGEAG
jgi:hypothetical protein